MTRWALRSLLTQPVSLAVSVAGLAVALLLVLLLEGIFVGESDQIVRYLEAGGADVWVMQDGVHNMHMATSLLSPSAELDVEAVEGVAEVTPILYYGTIVRLGAGRGRFAYVVGLDEEAARGGPWAMVEGRSRARRGEAVAPVVMARKSGLGLGAELVVAKDRFRVVGLSDETFSMANPIVFLHRDDVDALLGTSGALSYLLVNAAPGVGPSALAARIRAVVEDVEAYDAIAFAANDRALAMQMGGELIVIMTLVGALVGALIVGWTVYAFVARQRRALGVAKALGASNRQVVLAVAAQSATLALLGFVVAVACALALEPLLAVAVPDVAIHFTAPSVLRLGLVTLLIACAAAIVPARRVTRVDPATVFS